MATRRQFQDEQIVDTFRSAGEYIGLWLAQQLSLPLADSVVPAKKESDRALMTIREAAEYMGVCANTLHRFRTKGRLPFVQIGRRPMFRQQDIDRWIDRRTK